MKKPVTVASTILLLILALILSGCSFLGSGKDGSEAKKGTNVSKKDAPGKDIEGFPRYPGSVRTYFGEGQDTGGRPVIRVNYSANESADKVVMWFKDELSKKGMPPFSDAGNPSNEETLVYAFKDKTVTLAVQSVEAKQTWIVVEQTSPK